MRALGLNQYSTEQIMEMSLLELAFEIMAEKKQPVSFKELVDELKKLQNLTDEDLQNRLAQFYTDLNVDGRFTSLGENRWGLKTWYPVDQIEEEVVHTAKPKKKKARKAVDDEDLDDEDLDFEEEDDLLDDLDEEEDDLLDDLDEDDLADDDLLEDSDDDEELDEDLIDDEDEDEEFGLEDDEDEEEEEEELEDYDDDKKE
ncbi:DNA-directed RNA polymerase subunit delta [Peribacillus sp. SCS-155]|uniref:DNA-directed RNA polymerase subunit delta n=1 Tax=Peribacillus sedimenti TaxID=3115297 RepID=UPI0039068D31